LLVVGLIVSGLVERAAIGQPDQLGPPMVEDAEDRRVLVQLLAALEKNPRRGTVFDRIYGLSVERGRIDELLGRFRARTQGPRPEGAAWMITGLLEAQRGRDAAAVSAFREAERLRPADAMASYYLGQSLLLIGQPAEAVDAFERALARKTSNRNDLLEIYQALGQLHQRAQRTEQALAVWRRLEDQFPDDIRVRERIAAALAEDGQLEPALARYQALIKEGEARLKQPNFRLAAAELKARLGRRAEALADFEGLLADLPPEDWLGRETRRRLEDLFLRDDDLSGLVAYYEGQIARRPDDLEAWVRLAHHLQGLGRVADAQQRLEEGLRRAPTNAGLRLELISLLVEQQKFTAALAHYEQLNRHDPHNPDYLRDWGRLSLRDPSRPEAERRRAAADIWRRLLPGPGRRPDAAAVEQVADLFRQANMVDEALALYRLAVEIAPESASQRIRLGEYLHSLGRRVEALATWKVIAEGPRRDARSLKTLAEVLADFDYRAEAIEALTAARSLDPNDLGLILQLADLHRGSGQYAAALAVLEAGARLAGDPVQADQVLSRQIQCERGAGTLEERAASLEKALAGGREPGAEPWYRLARFREAARQWPAAATAIRRALNGDGPAAAGPASAPIWSAAARIFEGAGQPSQAAEALRRLAAIDAKQRAEALRQVARIEFKLNHHQGALQAGRELLAAAPGDAEHYRFLANLCFWVDARAEGIEVLQRAVRIAPNDPAPLLALAWALAESARPAEAIELDWKAFDKTEDAAGKRVIVSTLAKLYLDANQFDRLLERLERLRRERAPEQRRVLTLCIAQAHEAAGDLGTARRELERLLADQPGDMTLLHQLATLAEKEGDLPGALRFHQQLAKVAPRASQDALVGLLLRLGEVEEALLIWQREAAAAQGTRRLLELTDNLLFFGQAERALPVISGVLRDRHQDWEVLYRAGVALASLKRPDEAARRFQAILDLRHPDDELSVLLAASAGSGSGSKSQPRDNDRILWDRLRSSSRIRQEVGLDARDPSRKTFWTPADFGQARLAALVWLHTLSRKAKTTPAFLDQLRARRETNRGDLRGWWDWLYLHWALNDSPTAFAEGREASRALVKTGEVETQWIYLMYLDESRTGTSLSDPGRSAPLRTPSAAEIEQALDSFRILRERRPDWINADILKPMLGALKRAKRDRDEETVYRESIGVAARSQQVVSLMTLVGERGDVGALLQLFAKLDDRSWASTGASAYPSSQISQVFQKAMDARAEARSLADVARLVDGFLDANRRRSQAGRARAPNAPMLGDPIGSFDFRRGDYQRRLSMDFPAPNDFLDADALKTLGHAFMLYERADLLDDLIAHVRLRLGKAAPGDRSYEHVVLCGLYWWDDAREESLAELALASAASANPVVPVDLARMYENLGRTDEALAVLDAIPTPDQAALRMRELAALRVAARSGRIDRARSAAERLFALRLDAAMGLQVAASMQQMGLRNQAVALLDRIRVQAGGRADILLSLMTQYQAQKRSDAAAEVAYQILRISSDQVSTATRPYRLYVSSEETDWANARSRALELLARAGKLAPLIARAEAQLQTTPRSYHVLQTLRAYYNAIPDSAKARSILDRILAIRLEDPAVRFDLAGEFLQSGDTKAALGHYLTAFRAQPSLFSQGGFSLITAFQRAGRLPELATALDQADLDRWGISSRMQLLSTMIDQPSTRAEGLRLLRSLSQKPGYERGTISRELVQWAFGSSWKKTFALPQLYEIVRDDLVPQPAETRVETWSGIESYLPVFLAEAARQNRLSDLIEKVSRAATARPDWAGGQAILALIDVHRKREDQARARLLPLIDSKQAPMPADARRALVLGLEGAAELNDLALRIADDVDDLSLTSGRADYRGSLTQIHVDLYRSAGRLAEAQQLAMKTFQALARLPLDPSDYRTTRRLRSMDAIGRKLLELDAPLDATRVYASTLVRKPVDSDDREWDLIARGLERAVQICRAGDPLTILDELLPESPPNGTYLDLVACVLPIEPERVMLVSVLDEAVKRAAAEPGLLDRFRARLDRARAAGPRSLAVEVAAALVALSMRRAESAAVEGLERLVAETPLEGLSPKRRANARQRAAAAEQVGLWLVARACLRQESLRPTGARLGIRALEAARRQIEPASALAILREWGQLEREHGTSEAADARWGEMIAVVDTHVRIPAKGPGVTAKAPAASPIRPGHARILLQIAAMAARQDSAHLSLRIVADALRNGPPVDPAAGARRSFGRDAARDAADSIASRVIELDDVWRAHHAPADRVYETLRAIVLPDRRPAEAFLYALPLPNSVDRGVMNPSASTRVQPRGLGQRLADWAVQSGRAEDLRREAEDRLRHPMAEVAVRVLLVQLAMAGKDPKRAIEALDGLRARLEKESVGSVAELACHAGLSVLESPETASAGAALIERALPVLMAAGDNVDRFATLDDLGRSRYVDRDTGRIAMLKMELARVRFRAKDRDGGRKAIHEIVQSVLRPGPRSFRPYAEQSWLQAALAESVAAGQWSDAWDFLGQWLDRAPSPFSGQFSSGGQFLDTDYDRMTAKLATWPVAARYEFLKDWVLPSGRRMSLRLGSRTDILVDGTPEGEASRRGPSSTFELLIETAREAGRLDALAAAVRPLVEQKMAQAEPFALLIDIARGRFDDAAPRVRRRAEELAQRAARFQDAAKSMPRFRMVQDTSAAPEQMADALLALTCLAEPKLRDAGLALADRLIAFQEPLPTLGALSWRLRREAAAHRVASATGTSRVVATDLGLALWQPEVAPEPGGPASGWVESEGHLRIIPGSLAGPLRFVFPLAGTFEFGFEATGAGHIGYGGRSFPRPATSASNVLFPGSVPKAEADGGLFHRHRIRVGPDKLRCWIDGRLVYESDDLGRAHPWLTLWGDLSTSLPTVVRNLTLTWGDPSTSLPAVFPNLALTWGDPSTSLPAVFRNLTLTGSPEVPREVPLLAGGTIHWSTSYPTPLGPGVDGAGQVQFPFDDDEFPYYIPPPTRPEPPPPIWLLKENRLIVDRLPSRGSAPLPNRLNYDRPLRSGDSIRYEFLYEPGTTMVHPALGRVIFALEPDGVRVHGREWGSDGGDGSRGSEVPAAGRCLGPEKLSLKPGAWNRLVVAYRANTVTLDLNGVAIYERRLDQGDVPIFGLFHFRDRTAVRVRDVVLRGDWPRSLSAAQAADLTARTDGPGPIAERRIRHAWIGESLLRQDAHHVLARARTLPPSQRYEVLRAWVLPDSGLAPPRLDGVFRPCDPAPSVTGAIPSSLHVDTAAVPAAELVAGARAAGRLDELEADLRGAAYPAGNPGREQTALAVLTAIARERDEDARPSLDRLRSLLNQTKADPAAAFWPEFVAAAAALSRPALRRDASRLLDALTDVLGSKAGQDALSLHIRHVAAIAREPGPPAEPPECGRLLSYWRGLTTWTSASRGEGLPRPFWTWRDGELRHHPGHADDALVFVAPLRGDFQVSCELNLDDRRSTQIAYGGLRLEVAPDGKFVHVRQDESPSQSFPLEPPLDTRRGWHAYVLTVRGRQAETAIDGRPIYAARLPIEADPWLYLRQLGRREGGLRNPRITGNPEIPKRLDLSRGPVLKGWSAAYFGEMTAGRTADWEQQGSVIRGHRASVASGLHQESLLQYARPLFEDGFIEYEFYDGLGNTMAHPALDRLVFVLTPLGVRVHWLTDAQHDRTALMSDNLTDEPACRRGPEPLLLRVGEWNRLRITLVGHRATLQLNGIDIYERELEPNNRRIFGLFHEADVGEIRVRAIRYEGHWPGRLPQLNELMATVPHSKH
jgi:predicted Zn-dependent protease